MVPEADLHTADAVGLPIDQWAKERLRRGGDRPLAANDPPERISQASKNADKSHDESKPDESLSDSMDYETHNVDIEED